MTLLDDGPVYVTGWSGSASGKGAKTRQSVVKL
jgi:hypothetical protein